MKRSSKLLLACVVAVASLGARCAHAPPATGNHDPDAPIDPDYPEINCHINPTVDCRPTQTR